MLAKKLEHLKGEDVIVYALPRGGVVVAAPIARALGAPLDIVITRKIGHPHNPEYAICAVSESGELVCDEDEKERVDAAWLKGEVTRQMEEARRRRAAEVGRASLSPAGKTAIVVDDGVATGLSMRLAVREIQKGGPKRLVVAVPVAPADVAEALSRDAELVMLDKGRPYLGSVGAYYDSFPQVEDDEVVRLLARVVL